VNNSRPTILEEFVVIDPCLTSASVEAFAVDGDTRYT
jgi:hypothetical protein